MENLKDELSVQSQEDIVDLTLQLCAQLSVVIKTYRAKNRVDDPMYEHSLTFGETFKEHFSSLSSHPSPSESIILLSLSLDVKS